MREWIPIPTVVKDGGRECYRWWFLMIAAEGRVDELAGEIMCPRGEGNVPRLISDLFFMF